MQTAIINYINNIGANSGRSGHSLSIAAGRMVYEAREAVASLFNITDPLRVIFTMNATVALNTALYGLLEDGDTVVTSDVEHNSTMRPLRNLVQTKNITIKTVATDNYGRINEDELRKISVGAKLVTIVHGNNVTGGVSNLNILSKIAHENGAYFMTDAAQTAGTLNIDMSLSNIDILCASGHKGLYGPQGTGIMVIGENMDYKAISTLIQGGTGSKSEYELHPEILPDKFEAGTSNNIGIAGLLASIEWLKKCGINNNYNHEKAMRDKLYIGLESIDKVTLYASPKEEISTGVLSFTINELLPSEITYLLDTKYRIMSRAGLHCAPAIHKKLGTSPSGTVRLSVGVFTTEEDIKYTINAVREIAGGN